MSSDLNIEHQKRRGVKPIMCSNRREVAINNLLCLWRHGGANRDLETLNSLVQRLWDADQDE